MDEAFPGIENINNPKVLWIKRLAWFMDANFKIPFTNIRFGLDPLLSLIPGVGNIGTYLVSAFLVWQMQRNGASGKVYLKMLGNILLDVIISFIPILGTIFDIGYKANNRNVNLLIEHYEEGEHTGSGKGMLLGLFLITIGVIFGLIYGVYKLFDLFFEFLGTL